MEKGQAHPLTKPRIDFIKERTNKEGKGKIGKFTNE